MSAQEPDLPEFNVVQFFSAQPGGPPAGSYEYVRRNVTAKEAVEAAKHYTDNVAVKLGFIEKVIITDGGDSTVFMWEAGKGVTFPSWNEVEGRYVAAP